jgi:hypothetical protein
MAAIGTARQPSEASAPDHDTERAIQFKTNVCSGQCSGQIDTILEAVVV